MSVTFGTGIPTPLSSTSSVSSFPVSLPSYTAGDVWVLAVTCGGNFAVTPPAGWTQRNTQPQASSSGQDLVVFTRVPDGTEGNTVNVAFSASTRYAAAITYRITGADTTDPLSGTPHGENSGTASTTLANAGTTTADDGAAVLVIGAQGGSSATDATYTLPSGFDGKVETFGNDPFAGGCNLVGGYKTQATAGGTGTLPITSTLSGPWANVAIAFAPAPSAPPSLGACLLGVADKTTLTAGDTAVRDRLASSFDITLFSDEETPSLTGVDLVVLADSGVDATYGTWLTTAAVPVLTLGGMLTNLGLAATDPTQRTGTASGVDLVNNSHDVNFGLSDPLVIFSPAQNRWAVDTTALAAGVTPLALQDNNPAATVAGGVESGGTLTSGTAQARRAFATVYTDTACPALSANGLAYLDELALWCSQSPPPPTGSTDALTLRPATMSLTPAPPPTLRFTTDIDLGITRASPMAGLPALFAFEEATESVPVEVEVFIGGPNGEPVPLLGMSMGDDDDQPAPVQAFLGVVTVVPE